MFNEDDEIEVCDILLNLGTLIHQFETCPMIPLKWGNKRKRSNKESSSHHHPTTSSQSPLLRTIKTTSATFQSDDFNDDDVNNKVDANLLQDKVEASSPATPLSFSPSESDDDNKSKHSSLKKNFKKRSREEWMEIVEGLTQSREVLKREVENVRSYYNKLKAFNLELKTMKHERLTAIVRQQFPNMEINNLGINIGQHHGIPMINPLQNNNFVIFDGFQYPKNCHLTQHLLSSSSSSSCNGNVVGPCGIPDLNVSPEEVFGPLDHSQSLDGRKAMAAEKRMIRRMINIKKKNELRSR